MHQRRLTRFALGVALILAAGSAQAIMIGQVQNFDGQTNPGWVTSFFGAMNPNPPSVVSSSNLSGDAMQLVATGDPMIPRSQPGGKLTAFEVGGLWSGDYLGAGVSGITMDLYNSPESSALSVRVLMMSFNDDFSVLQGAFYSSDAIGIEPGQTLDAALFSLQQGALTDLLGGASDYATVFSDVDSVRIFHNPDGGTLIGGPFGAGEAAPFVSATLEVDNITAIPEPTTAVLLSLGLLGLVSRPIRAGVKHR